MKLITTFDTGILKYAVENNILKPVALYYLIKAKYNHSIIYNYNPYRLVKITGLHHKTIKRYVDKLLRFGFCELRDGHLLFIGRNKIELNKRGKKYSRTLVKIQTRPYTSFQGILNRIHYVMIKNNKAQQEFKIATHYGKHLGALSPRVRRKVVKNFQENQGLENSDKAIITLRSASRLFNVSAVTAHQILTKLKDNNYLKFQPYTRKIGKSIDIRYTSNGYFFNRYGYLYQYLGRTFQDGRYSNRLNSFIKKV